MGNYESGYSNVSEADNNLFTSYAGLGDNWLTGGVLGKAYAFWALVIGMLNFLLYLYVCQWSILFNLIIVVIEAAVILAGLIWNIVNAVWSARDIHELAKTAAGESERKKPSLIGFATSERSRVNAATDLSMFLSAGLFVIFEFTLVFTLIYGNVGNHWYNGRTNVINYPLSNTAHYPTLTGAVIEQVTYRSNLHLFIVIKDAVLIAFLLFTRINAINLQVSVERMYAKKRIFGNTDRVLTDPEMHHIATPMPVQSKLARGLYQ